MMIQRNTIFFIRKISAIVRKNVLQYIILARIETASFSFLPERSSGKKLKIEWIAGNSSQKITASQILQGGFIVVKKNNQLYKRSFHHFCRNVFISYLNEDFRT